MTQTTELNLDDVSAYMKAQDIHYNFVALLHDLNNGQYIIPVNEKEIMLNYCNLHIQLLQSCIDEYNAVLRVIELNGSTMRHYLEAIELESLARNAILVIEKIKEFLIE